jgi:hypothetical protein
MNDPNAGVIQILDRTQPWVRLVSIVGFVTVALMIVIGFVGGALGMAAEIPELAVLLVYPLIGVLYFFPSLYLYKYARRIGMFVAQGHQVHLEAALDAQRAFWKFVGVVVLLSVVVSVFTMVAAVVVGVLSGQLFP